MSRPETKRLSLDGREGVTNARERERITSGLRLSVALMIMVTVIVGGLTGLVFLLVSRVFDSMTPSVASDLAWKARRGAVELSKTAELGLVVGDREIVRQAARDYLQSSDVVNVVALSGEGQVVFEHGSFDENLQHVFELAPNRVHALEGRLVAWAPASIEGEVVGRVLVGVSTARLRAGDELRGQLTTTAFAGGFVALLLAFGFVVLYILPILRLTESAFRRLEHTTRIAVEAARMKAQFLANMSHEIRTPMNAVVGLSKLMLGMPLGPKVRRYAERIDTSSRSLLNIINDILDFSKLEAGKYQNPQGAL
ncbi:MAG: histidine kinase dimerization/phospho-acceptor domain-containing protein [Myxococcales bacterium]